MIVAMQKLCTTLNHSKWTSSSFPFMSAPLWLSALYSDDFMFIDIYISVFVLEVEHITLKSAQIMFVHCS